MYICIYMHVNICIYMHVLYIHITSLFLTHTLSMSISKYGCPYPNIHTRMHVYIKENKTPPLRNIVKQVHQKRETLCISIYVYIYFYIFINVLYIFLYLYLCVYLSLFINRHTYICRYIHVMAEKRQGDRRARAHR